MGGKEKKDKKEKKEKKEMVDEVDEPKMDLGDQWGMKRLLDETAGKILEDAGYPTEWR